MKSDRPLPKEADIIINNVRALTSDPHNPRAEALALRGKRIVFVGSQEDAGAWQRPHTRTIDGQGFTLTPGFIDSHFHLEFGALQLDTVQLGQVKNLADFIETVRSFIKDHSNHTWLEGNGLLYSIQLPDGVSLSRHHLDEVSPDLPFLVTAFDGHTCWANTLALEKAGILHGRELPPGNEIVMGADGLASGELREPAACKAVLELIPPPTPAQRRELVRKGMALAARAGITSIHNMDGSLEQITRYAAMEDAGEMTLRIYVPRTIPLGASKEDLDEAEAMKRDFHTHLVRGGAVKFFMDGVIESGTGLLLDDYEGRPGWKGEAQFPYEEFVHLAMECDRRELQIAVHSVGDGAVRRDLDCFETIRRTNPPWSRRHSIEHIELVHDDDLGRFAALDVTASMQPLHAPLSLHDPDPWPKRVGEWRWRRSFAWESLRKAGARLVFGSDWPVVSLNPILGLRAAISRQPWAPDMPHHRQNLLEVLDSYTRSAAIAECEEDRKGMLRAGMFADVVLLSADLEKVPVDELEKVHPLLTICDGRIVYQS
jgi:predicted amidohydrolase YtcJ